MRHAHQHPRSGAARPVVVSAGVALLVLLSACATEISGTPSTPPVETPSAAGTPMAPRSQTPLPSQPAPSSPLRSSEARDPASKEPGKAPAQDAAGLPSSSPVSSASEPRPQPTPPASEAAAPKLPLAGIVVALDPGHNRGNFQHPDQINEPLFVGLWKTCNTTGTATSNGYLEADYNWDVSRRLSQLLRQAGATVKLTRTDNNDSSWGPCIDKRAAFGAQVNADAMVSIHADGGPSGGYGHYVMAPGGLVGYTDDIAQESYRLAESLLSGLADVDRPESTYASEPIYVSDDYGTLNLADVPTVIVETVNMNNQSDATFAESPKGRERIAQGLFLGLLAYFSASA